MYKAVVIKDIHIHIHSHLHIVSRSSDKRIILDILGDTHAHDGRIQQRYIAKATSSSEKTTRARNLQGMTQGALDRRISAARGQSEADPGSQFKKGMIQISGWM